jgi:hypothetical protein
MGRISGFANSLSMEGLSVNLCAGSLAITLIWTARNMRLQHFVHSAG